MPSPLRNGDATPRIGGGEAPHRHHFHSSVSERKVRRINALILLLRFAAFCFSIAAAIFMVADSPRSGKSASWQDIGAFRLVFAANSIVAVYSMFEAVATICEIQRGATLLPESLQLWFDFSHDQVFAYLLLAAEAVGTLKAQELGRRSSEDSVFCVQADISVALGFVGFGFLALSAIISGSRLACFTVTGSHLQV